MLLFQHMVHIPEVHMMVTEVIWKDLSVLWRLELCFRTQQAN